MRVPRLQPLAVAAATVATLAGCGSAPHATLRSADESRLMRHLSDARRAAASADPQGARAALGALGADVSVQRAAGRLDDAQAQRLRTEIGQARARVAQEVHAPAPPPAPTPAPPPAATPATPPDTSPAQKAKDALKRYGDAVGKFLNRVRGDNQGAGNGGGGGD